MFEETDNIGKAFQTPEDNINEIIQEITWIVTKNKQSEYGDFSNQGELHNQTTDIKDWIHRKSKRVNILSRQLKDILSQNFNEEAM